MAPFSLADKNIENNPMQSSKLTQPGLAVRSEMIQAHGGDPDQRPPRPNQRSEPVPVHLNSGVPGTKASNAAQNCER
jgi:hypothetical protein